LSPVVAPSSSMAPLACTALPVGRRRIPADLFSLFGR
jgi:hypothetical protein